jgi:2-oxoglutarate/2-oxoacid ferredoxin oxidoreductase subunit alpha
VIETTEGSQAVECRDLTLAIVGSGGDGVISAGEIIVKAAASEGLHAFLLKSFGPQIRGGESSCKIRLSPDELLSIGEESQILLCFSWGDYSRFNEEIHLAEDAIIISDTDDKVGDSDVSLPMLDSYTWIKAPLKQIASKEVGNPLTKNIVSLGVLERLFRLPEKGIAGQIRKRFSKKKQEIIDLNLNAIAAGAKWADELLAGTDYDLPTFYDFTPGEANLMLTGNEAAAMGALWSGLDFFAGYPITPGTDIMEWLERHLPLFDGTMIQAEDEIAAIGMVIGASFAGAKAMTATSGPGIALMSEMIGLASIAEIPTVIVNVQRGGPSTGIPTKTSQSDLLQACYCTHGDAPHVVMAATDVKDCTIVASDAFYISEKYQIPVIILLDQFVGQRIETVKKYDLLQKGIDEGWIRKNQRLAPTPEQVAEGYKRFEFTENGVSPISSPGMADGDYIASGIEHDEKGYPVSDVGMHRQMHEKRYSKLEGIAKETGFMREYGTKDSRIGILCWGSSKGPAREAIFAAENAGVKSKCLIPTTLMPLNTARVQEFVDSCDKVIVADSSFSAQFLTYLKAQVRLDENKIVDMHFVDGMPLPVEAMKNSILEVHNELA